MKEQDELAETILALPEDEIVNFLWSESEIDIKPLQTIVREWKAYRAMMATVKESHKEACSEPEWCVNCVVCYVQQRVDEAFAAIQKENK